MERSQETLDRITAHVEKHIGEIHGTYAEIVPGVVAVDLIVVAPTPRKNYYTLVTSGMSDLPMSVPQGAEDFTYAELMMCLPPDWKISDEAFQDENNYWPVRAMKTLARFPHEHDTWLYLGHTVAYENAAVKSYAENNNFRGMLLSLPDTVEDKPGFFNLQCSDNKVIHFFNLTPLYQEELDYKLKHGMEALFGKLNAIGVGDVVDQNRNNACKKKLFGLF